MTSRRPPHIEPLRLSARGLCDVREPAAQIGGLPQTNEDAAGGNTKGGHAHGKGEYPMATRLAVSDSALVSHEIMKDWIFRTLRIAIFVKAETTAEKLSVDSGVPIASIRSYMKGTAEERREPCASYALSLAVAIGPWAVNSFMALIGFIATPMEEPDEPQPTQLVFEGLSNLSIIAEAAVDNRFSPDERQRVTFAADAVIAAMLPISSQADAA